MRSHSRRPGAGGSSKPARPAGAGIHDRRRCEFQLLRYVPDPVRNEFVHIGVILREQPEAAQPDGSPKAATDSASQHPPAPNPAPGPAQLRFTRDWRRVRCLDPDADTALLENMETELRRRFLEEPNGNLMRLLSESLSLGIQMTEPKAYLAESIPAGLEELMRLYVDPAPRERVSRLSGRAAIQSEMRAQFEHAGVWDLLRKKIAAADYTRPGDPLRIDLGYGLGYRPNGLIRMFHAVSLDTGIDAAKGLAFSAAALRAGVERIEKAGLELTAIIEPAAKIIGDGAGASDEASDRLAAYRFGVETMEEHHIRVLTTSDLSRVAETARRELRV